MKWKPNGAVAHTFTFTPKLPPKFLRTISTKPTKSTPTRRSQATIYKSPTPSPQQNLARALHEALETGGAGHQMAGFGAFIRDIPSRIGHNTALDTAVACLVNVHSTLVRQKDTNDIVNPQLYLRAVQTLQTNLGDHQKGLTSNTLCASVILGIVEALAGPRPGNRYLAHVGGAGRLMEHRGPKTCQDQFTKEILRFNRGGIVSPTGSGPLKNNGVQDG